MSQKLTGKVAVVTGASKGIGAEIARRYAAEGATVVVNYASSKAGADKVVADITAKGGKALAVQADVSNPADITRLVADTKKAYGKIDILVNNAGIYDFKALGEITPEHFHSTFNLNVLGLILTTQKALKVMPDGGAIINVGSVVGESAFPGTTVYSATKAAVNSITRIHAKELGGRKIRVNALNPGMVETEGTNTKGITNTNSDFEKQVVATTPLGRIGQPGDIGKVAVFLASEESGWMTGELLYVSGGSR
jgi:3-oxoacyl-[acyl-carrier protein] reductase